MLLLSTDIDQHIEKFISKERPLREYVIEIERMKNMASEIASLPVYVPMHFFLLDCTGINLVSTRIQPHPYIPHTYKTIPFHTHFLL